MNFYEELGVERGAPTEEIRQAYKTLARLLHPDGQMDERLRVMADRQMKRLHEMLGILSDPEQRRRYDESLPGGQPGPAARWACDPRFAAAVPGEMPARRMRGADWAHAASRYWFWVLIGTTCACAAAIWWVLPSDASPGEVRVVRPDPAPARAAAVPGKKAEEERGRSQKSGDSSRPRAVNSAAQAAIGAGGREELQEFPVHMPENSLEILMQGRRAQAAPVDPSAAEEPNGAAANGEHAGFAGNWFYSPRAGEKADPDTYRAIYIELVLKEDQGDLMGVYRARYQVPDQAISPNVVLRVRGKSAPGDSLRADWTAPDGAKGILQMTLESPSAINVAWWTTEFGRQQRLTSGSAELVRLQTR